MVPLFVEESRKARLVSIYRTNYFIPVSVNVRLKVSERREFACKLVILAIIYRIYKKIHRKSMESLLRV